MKELLSDAIQIMQSSIERVLPNRAVREALRNRSFPEGRLIVVSIGKAAWEMARAAEETIGTRIDRGIVITKYGHCKAKLACFEQYEAGHPVPDENGVRAAERALELVKNLDAEDTVLLLLSGGGSALFEKPLLPLSELEDLTQQLLASGANISEINTIRKRFSAVKGGRFALACMPAKVETLILSDVLGDDPGAIASGPAYPDQSTAQQTLQIADRYALKLTDTAKRLLQQETPKELSNVVSVNRIGSIRQLCETAKNTCIALGYETEILTEEMTDEAREAGVWLANIAKAHALDGKRLAFLAGGETVVHLHGTGKGGRNQELALAAALEIETLPNVCIFSFGSDGTDGPTDAAGGIVTGKTAEAIRRKGYDPKAMLENNDAYHALQAADALLMTGPTGTNVNDLAVVLIDSDTCIECGNCVEVCPVGAPVQE